MGNKIILLVLATASSMLVAAGSISSAKGGANYAHNLVRLMRVGAFAVLFNAPIPAVAGLERFEQEDEEDEDDGEDEDNEEERYDEEEENEFLENENEDEEEEEEEEEKEVVGAWFVNNLKQTVELVYVDTETGETHPATPDGDRMLKPGHSVSVGTQHGHMFHAYVAGGVQTLEPLYKFEINFDDKKEDGFLHYHMEL